MQQPPLREGQTPKHLMHRLDRLFGDMNAFLIVLAIGLAVLDFSCFTALRAAAEIQVYRARAAAQTDTVAPGSASETLGFQNFR